jgi:hypothetical protein
MYFSSCARSLFQQWEVAMKKILLLALIVVVVGLLMEDRLKGDFSTSISRAVPALTKEHTLYSWTSANKWHFAIVTKGERVRSIEEIKKSEMAVRGLEGLRDKLDQLPRHQRIVWRFDEPGLNRPTKDMIVQVKRYCENNGLAVEIATGKD